MNFRSISVAYLHFDSQVTGLNTQIAPRMHFENGHLSSHGGFIANYVESKISVCNAKVFDGIITFITSTSFYNIFLCFHDIFLLKNIQETVSQ